MSSIFSTGKSPCCGERAATDMLSGEKPTNRQVSAQRQPARTVKGRKARRRGRRQSDLTLMGLLGDDLTHIELALRGADRRRSFYLKTPTGCKKPLNFVAIVTTTEGRKLVAKDEVKLKGRGCG